MKKRILSLIIALSFVLTALPVVYASESGESNSSQNTSFTFDLSNTMHTTFSKSNPNSIDTLAAVGNATTKRFRAFHRVEFVTPYEAALLAFTTSASSLSDDEKVYLNLKVDGYDNNSTANGSMCGGKVKVIYSSAGYPTGTDLDKSVYALSENKINESLTDFKIDVTKVVKQALLNATAVSGIKTIQLLAEVDPADTPHNESNTRFLYYDVETPIEKTYLGGTIQYGENAPFLTVEKITPELSDIKIDGVSLKDFESSTEEYTFNVAYSYQGLPQIEGIKKNSEATVEVIQPTSIPGTSSITVTIPSGKTKTYTINIGRAEVSPELTDIKIDGVSVEGFESSKEEYTHILSYNYNKTPEVSVAKKDPEASSVIELPSHIPGNVVIKVTTPDQKSKTYKVYLKRKEVTTELTDIKIDGVSIDGFNEEKKEYTYYLNNDYQGIPVITSSKKDNDATSTIIMPDSIPGTCYIDVSDYLGKVTTYKVYLRYESSKTNPTTFVTLPKVTYTDSLGTEINEVPLNAPVKAVLNLKELRDEDNITFVTALYNDGFMIDKVSSKKQGNETSLTNTLNITLSDVSKAKIKSFILTDYKDGKNVINCSELASSNNNLKGIWFNNSLMAGFNKSVLNYKLNIPASVLNYPEFIIKTEDSGVKTEVTYPAKLSGTVSVKTTANNSESKTYNVEFERKEAEIKNIDMDYDGKEFKIYENIQQPVFDGESGIIANCINPINPIIGQNYIIGTLDEQLIGGTLIALPYRSVDPQEAYSKNMLNYLDKTGFITFDINRSATVYVSWTKQDATPAWIGNEGFEDISSNVTNTILTADNSNTTMKYMYKKHFEVPEWSETPVAVPLGATDKFGYWWIIVVFDK